MSSHVIPKIKMDEVFVNKVKFKALHVVLE